MKIVFTITSYSKQNNKEIAVYCLFLLNINRMSSFVGTLEIQNDVIYIYCTSMYRYTASFAKIIRERSYSTRITAADFLADFLFIHYTKLLAHIMIRFCM
jgi:hypothetical protein